MGLDEAASLNLVAIVVVTGWRTYEEAHLSCAVVGRRGEAWVVGGACVCMDSRSILLRCGVGFDCANIGEFAHCEMTSRVEKRRRT